MSFKQMISVSLFLVSLPSFAQAKLQQKPSPGEHGASAHQATIEEEGARVFRQNCSRCHNIPDGFSPRISGTVVRHMRVRASLSAEEEKQLLRFLNP